ncbi:MAG: tripartite tricarboxylate transporter permease [Sphaerochaetaceae bacterium]|nr:tripartite tricarboxylate transporter permease [Sphaerochaetaceae bacterium]MDC7248241.1 tripartite tricarboxylate transporter permease [Sphaerochaetaceae bacterium]
MAFEYLFDAILTVSQPLNIMILFLSTAAGLLMGMLPGLSATMAIALLTGLTYNFPTQSALISLLGVYVGAISGGCQSAILLNIPGTPASAATALDGFPMARRGEGGLAIFLATTSSFLGTFLSVIFVLTLTPVLTQFALKFASWEFFLLSIFGIMICGSITARGNALKGWISGILGLMVAQIGMDIVDTFPRYSYGNVNLMSSIQLIPVMIGLFGFPEIVKSFVKKEENRTVGLTRFEPKKGFRLIGKNIVAIIRSAAIGVGVGIIPGVGEDTGGWLSYWASKQNSKDKESFGKGNPLGIISAESGNNSCIGGAIIPVLSLAVPGSAPAAVLLAAFLMHGYRPGPLLMTESPSFVYNVCIYLAFASFAMWAIALLISHGTVRLLALKKKILMPIIYTLCVIGAYLIHYNMFDVKVMFVFGMVGILITKLDIPAAPFLLGVILGPMADSNLRRGLRLSNGSMLPMLQRPICIFFLLVILFMIFQQTGLIDLIKRKGKKDGDK